MTRDDITRIRWVSDPRIAPDGRRVAFVVTTLDTERDEALSSVWLVDTDGGEPRRFTTGPRRDSAPRWSPDGRWLAFLSEREGPKKKPQLWVLPADGGEACRLTDLPNGAGDPVWAPEGRRLAFVARVGGWQEPESEEERLKSRPIRVITTLKYKSNGEGFVYDRRPHVFVVDLDGGPPRPVTGGDFVDADPAWSPDGRSIAFVSARHDDRDHDDASDIWLVPAEGGEPRRLTATAGPVAQPAFSPDGATIAYFARRPANAVGRNVRLHAVGVHGGAETCLTERLDRSLGLTGRPLWSPDGAWILAGAEDEGRGCVFRIAAKAPGVAERVLAGDRIVGAVSMAPTGRVAFIASDPTSPAEVFVADASGASERRVTDLNGAWKDEVALVRPEPFGIERAGHRVQGWVMRPFGAREGARYPALLNIHGGPHAAYGLGFFDEFQVYAGAGYAVICTNPRGSQGYGEAFTSAVVGDWGGGDVADVMAALDEALARFPFLDPARLGVMGGSYGGFMTSWIVGHSDRFVAACSERAVNSQLTMFGTSDIGHLFNVLEMGGTLPWEDFSRWVERSPLTYAAAIRTPLLIVHSEDDLRCPMSEAEQLFAALKKLRREVVLVRVPDENHELSRSGRPRHRLERFRIILDWFDRHLGCTP
jgi:dipeptidyl aminopeptidase/acylaminoacyl peptidase